MRTAERLDCANELLQAALEYAKLGLAVFPCGPDKRPWTPHGFKDATTKIETIRRWWAKWPDALIGMPTGPNSGFAVLDLDVKNGKNGLAAVPDWQELSPAIVRTRSGGIHVYFKDDSNVTCTSDQLALGVDTRGVGGYVIVPPSPGYQWLNGHDLAALPPWPERLRPPQRQNRPVSGDAPEPGPGVLAAALAAIPNNDLGWDDWNKIGMALWRATRGSEDGFKLFDQWSGKSPKHNIAERTRDRWNHYTGSPPDTIGAGTIFHMADEADLSWRLRSPDRLNPTLNKPRIVVRGGDQVAIVSTAEVALLAAHTQIFQRGGGLVRPMRFNNSSSHDSIRRASGATVLTAVNETWLTEQFAAHIEWLRLVRTKDGESRPVVIDPGPKYARTLLARSGTWKFPVLRGLVRAPTLAFDGRIIQSPGYDADSGMYLDFEEGTFPPVPDNPTREQAQAALEMLARPLRAFPFVDEASKAVALSALLTALIRSSLRTTPLHAFDAPTAGTGKSMLAEMAGLLSTGARPAAMSQGKSAEEDEKRLSTVLQAGDPVILIDNCERPVQGDFLCSMLSQETVQARILGLSERRILPCTAIVLATGNNLILQGDIARRAIICRLDSKDERPDLREFDFDAQEELLADRAQLVVAGLTALRAFKMFGTRPHGMKPMGSFNDWDWVRGTLVWAGYADPADTRSAIMDADPVKTEVLEIMDLWTKEFADRWVTVADISKLHFSNPLHQALVDCCGGEWNSKGAGRWLLRQKDRVVGNRAFRNDRARRRWMLEGTKLEF